jgi:manganese/zinc/iron transport system substrate-binding protein
MRQVPAVFIESTVSPKTIEALQAAVIARGGNVALGGELYSDSLGDINTPAASYVGMLRHNVQTIVSALKGDA